MSDKKIDTYTNGPDDSGHFGIHGGRFVPEPLMPVINEIKDAYEEAKKDPEFIAELKYFFKHYVGRPSPVYFAERLTEEIGGAKIYFKREDLNHTGAHKINNAVGQALLAKRMGKKRLIAETGAGQHGVATATVAARFNMSCAIYMGEVDVKRQMPNVFRMKLLGSEVHPVTVGSATLKDAINEAMKDWVANMKDTYYLFGTAAGPHPFPAMVRDFQKIIGEESKEQMNEIEGRLPDTIVACVGGGSNAIGLFHPYLDDTDVKIVGVEPGGDGIETGRHGAPLTASTTPGILHGSRSYIMQNDDGQILESHSVSAGLDYPGVGAEHSWLKDMGRAQYVAINDDEALEMFHTITRTEGIIPALESSHAVAHAAKMAKEMSKDEIILVNLSGRGDKDIPTIAKLMGHDIVE
ncbi:MAG: tryptophan synthase subunit beta [Alphaproteobacteria bacterium]|nr:tryptophan synthase subunit beta [Alphaproteobacteria bacterium]